jgi:cell division protease FtsH
VAKETPGFSGADLNNLVNEAAILAARRGKRSITFDEFGESIDRVLMGPERRSRVISHREKEITAYHEAGHALVGHTLPNADKVQKVSIIARGMAAGYTKSLPSEDRHIYSEAQFKALLATSLGGRVAEEMIFNELTTGASNDLETATHIARSMVTRYGMSKTLGPRTFGKREELVFLGREISEQRDYSDRIADEIDGEVHDIILEAHSTAREVLDSHKAKLVQLARHLITHETIEGDELTNLLESAAPPLEAAPEPTPAN